MTRRCLVFALLVVTVAVDAAAQRFGQWSWDASVRLGQRTFGSSVGGDAGTTCTSRHLTLGLGLNGFIFHPTVVQFRLGVQANTARFDDRGSSQKWSDLGLSGEVNIFPYGAKRFSLYGNRQSFDYGTAGFDDPLVPLYRPDTVTTFGARFRSRAGTLRGLSLEADRTGLDYLGVGAQRDVRERESADWAGGGRRLMHHYRIQRERRDYGNLDYSSDELTALVDEHGALSPTWRFDQSGSAARRSYRSADSRDSTYSTVLLRSQLEHSARRDNVTTIAYNLGMAFPSSAAVSQNHSLSVRHRWRASRVFSLEPTASFATARRDGASVNVPALGLGATLAGRVGAFAGSLTAGITFRELRVSGTARQPDQSSLATSAGGSLSAGDETRLRAGIEAEWSRDDLHLAGEAIEPLPDLGTTLGAGSQDARRVRVTLSHSGGLGGHFSLYSEAGRRDVTTLFTGEPYRVETVSHSLSGQWRRASGVVSAGSTTVSGAAPGEIEFFSADVGFSVTSFATVRAAHRIDLHHDVVGPDVNRQRSDLTVDLAVGAFVIRLDAYQDGDRPLGGPRRTNRGVSWSLARRFGGWLPIVSAPERRGVIR